jgi:DNA-binding HxlR family transcriptional regulator
MMTLELHKPGCAPAMMLERMANRWTIPVVALISAQPIRFNQLRRAVDGISQKMLSQTLKALERDGLISRKVTPTVPISVEYSLTDLGRTLVDVFSGLQSRSEMIYSGIIEAQQRFDQSRSARSSSVSAMPM